MKRRWIRMLAAFAAAAGMMLSCTAPAAAYVENAAQQETAGDEMSPEEKKKTNEKTAGPLDEETPEKSEPSPFSMPGNAKLVDDAGDDDTKQFLSVQTKNGNVFYIVVDRSGSTENVYMMSLVDENDLKEFIKEDSGEDTDGQAIQPVPDLETSADTETGDGQEKQEDDGTDHKKGTGMGGMLPVLFVFGGCAAGIYYFKILRPQKDADTDMDEEDEEAEFYDEYGEKQKEEPEIEE